MTEAEMPSDDFFGVDDDREGEEQSSARSLATARFFKLTDTGNAERFAKRHAERVRYCAPLATWFTWDGVRWVRERRAEVGSLAKDTVRAIYAEAAQASDDVRKAIGEWAKKSESREKRAAMVDLARSEPGISILPEDLDRDPWLLNCPNGTLDLRTGKLRPHRREDLLTQVTAANYDPAATSARWKAVVDHALGGDPELKTFFQRAAGYSLCGLTSEEKLFMPIGPTRTGKSTIVQSIRKALGDYARVADFEAFIAQKNPGGPKNEIARLAGARFVVSVEVDKGRRLAQGLVKTLTGGDRVTARFLYQEAFEFEPTFKLWLVANDAPHVPDDDEAMWARILRIPFEHPPEVKEPAVKLELCDVERSGAAILAWAVRGCLDWQKNGLGVPKAVTDATNEYRDGENPLVEFVAECTLIDPQLRCTRKSLRDAYELWAAEAGGRLPITGKDFNERIRRLPGVKDVMSRGVRWWRGLGLLSTAPSRMEAGEHTGAVDS